MKPRPLLAAAALCALAPTGPQARADEPPPQKTSPTDPPAADGVGKQKPAPPDPPAADGSGIQKVPPPAPPAAVPRNPGPDRVLKVPTDPLVAPSDSPLQVPTVDLVPRFVPPPPRPRSDGAGPRIGFGRTFTERAKDGFYGRFESEYFEVHDYSIWGGSLGLEGWGSEGAKDGGGSILAGVFGGSRSGARPGERGPSFLFTLGAGLHVILFDKIGADDGFGLFSPYAHLMMGLEPIAGIRLLCDARAVYRWHWTAPSEGQIQVGATLDLNSYLWDGP